MTYAVIFNTSFDAERPTDPRVNSALLAAVAISLLAHLVALVFWGTRDPVPHSTLATYLADSRLQIQLTPPTVMNKPEPVNVAEPLIEPSIEPAAEPQPVAAADVAPEDAAVKAPPTAPGRVSILRSVDDYVANLPLSSEYLQQETSAEPSTIFHPALRQALRGSERDRAADDNQWLLNNSTVADVGERVALAGKCFRLEDLGGGGGRRAWYPVKCRGQESTSDAMARGLNEALERR